MQPKDHTLSGTRSVNLYAKLIIISIASIFGLMLLTSDPAVHLKDTRTPASGKTDITSAAKKMFNESNRLHKTAVARALIAPVDTNRLKQSDWFTAVTQDIEKRMYCIVADKDDETFQSINSAQYLKASYSPYQFSIQNLPLQDKKQQLQNDWQLNIVVTGLYEDGKLLKRPQSTVARVVSEDNMVEYNFGDAYSIQYQNSAKGIRQNFIMRQKPAADVQELKVSMKAKGDWVVNKVHDRELHFAKKKGPEGLENKITYNDLRAWDANGKPLAARMEVVGDNKFDIITEVAGAVYPVTIDPLSTTPSTTLTGSGNFGWSVASAGDLNGDGYSDVVVGDAGGHAYIYLGSASGLSSSIATTLSGVGFFGTSVASAGDVNGDGFSDVIVGDAGGNAFLYLGSSSGLSAVPATTITGLGAFGGGISVASAGDVNGDGFSDVVVSAAPSNNAYIYLGSALGLSGTIATTLHEATGNFGASVASAGDVNGDGFSDVIVGDAAGKAYVFLGAGGGLSSVASVTLTEAGVNFGWSVASAGDVNGDGFSDVIVGDHGGNAYVFQGSLAGLSTTAAATLTGNPKFGTSVACAGDVNGDAFSDVIVGADDGNAFVFNGSSTGIASGTSATANTALTGAGSNYGICVNSAGDVNGDGYSDVIVGSSNATNAFTYEGSPSGSQSTSTLTILGTSNGGGSGCSGPTPGCQEDRLGFSVSSAGDLNGDGYSDVIVGVIGYNGITGAAYIYYGSSTGLSTGSPTVLTIPYTGTQENFGWSVAGAGDINGDGYDDVVIGAKYQNGNIGAAYIYLGSSSGIVNSIATTLNGINNFDAFGSSVASAGDVNGDGYYDIIIGSFGAGVAYIYMGSATGIANNAPADTLYAPNPSSGFGISVASAGDVNGDGYSDVIVGTLGGGGGFAYVYKGSATGIANKATPDYSLTGVGGDFGVSVSSAGDVNGDGYSDVIVGASNVNGYIGGGGAVSVFLGGIGGLSTTPSTVLFAVGAGDQFGATVSSAGDVNGDGYSDVIVRATLATSSSGALTGAAYLYLGGPTGLSSTIATSFLDEGSPNANLEAFNLRRSVASAGDVNGDGYSDVLVGVYEDPTAGFKAGATHVYYGNNASGLNASNKLRLYETNLTSPIAADNLTQPNFGLGLFVQSPFGTVKGRLVWETEGNGAPFLSTPPNPITNSVVLSGNQTSYSAISPGGTEFKNLIPKALAKATKVRVRIQYAPSAVTFGQVFSPWIYSQAFLQGSNVGILPLDLLSFTATAAGENIVLNWKTSNEVNLQNYVIEHSLNTIAFDSVGQVAATGNSFSTASYDFTHFGPGAGIHFYRLKEVDVSGHFTYSRVVSAKINSNVAELNIFPNPASDHIIIKHSGISGNYIRIMNASGSIVGQYLFDPSSAQSTISVKSLARGNYFVEIVNSGYTPKQIAIQ